MLLLIISLVLIPVIPGISAAYIIDGKKQNIRKSLIGIYLVGWILCMLVAGAANGLTVVAGKDLNWCTQLFVLLLGVLEIGSLGLWVLVYVLEGRNKRQGPDLADSDRKKGTGEGWLLLVFVLLVVLQIGAQIVRGYCDRTGDMTLELVQSFLDTGQLYEQNPLTGQAYEIGVPLRIRILCLPGFYAILCNIFKLPAEQVVWAVMPLFHMLCGYGAFYLVADKLFSEKQQRNCFLVLVALLLGMGTYGYGMDGLGMLYQGFRGETLRAVVLLPLTVYSILERRWLLWLLCLILEACLVWTLYGMGACLWLGVGLYLVMWIRRYLSGRKKGEVS